MCFDGCTPEDGESCGPNKASISAEIGLTGSKQRNAVEVHMIVAQRWPVCIYDNTLSSDKLKPPMALFWSLYTGTSQDSVGRRNIAPSTAPCKAP